MAANLFPPPKGHSGQWRADPWQRPMAHVRGLPFFVVHSLQVLQTHRRCQPRKRSYTLFVPSYFFLPNCRLSSPPLSTNASSEQFESGSPLADPPLFLVASCKYLLRDLRCVGRSGLWIVLLIEKGIYRGRKDASPSQPLFSIPE